MNDATQHLQRAQEDYSLLEQFDIRTVRETIGWRLVEKNGRFDFSEIESRARAAREKGMQIVWTLCHYGWPDDIDVLSPEFVDRFARYCGEAARHLAAHALPDVAPVFVPINEISFTCWAAASGRMPHAEASGDDGCAELKRQLVRASIAGMKAIREVEPGARFLHCDPLIHVAAPYGRADLEDMAARMRREQFEAWDMLCGRLEPELGGAPEYLDLIGVNHFHDNQWEAETNELLEWRLDDPRRRPLHAMLDEAWRRYKRPMLIAETSHVGACRGAWIREVAHEAALARNAGVELLGICLYPVIDRPDWVDSGRWHYSGLWDVIQQGDERFHRALCEPYAAALKQAQRMIGGPAQDASGASHPQTILVFSHLRWDFVYQRPQHLLSRLAERYRVVFVEEPLACDGVPHWEKSEPSPNVLVCRPRTRIHMPGFHDDQLPELRELVRGLVGELVTSRQQPRPIVWFYTPMALPLLQECDAGLVVYDCMDELSAFRNAPRQLLQRESALLKIADVVFTGGPSLFAAKKERHPDVHCFSSSVDVVHFEQALDRTNSHPAHKDIPGPRLGYYGVIDERFDPGLIAQLADAHPQWQIVLVGPIVKIDPAVMPRRPNIHYMGQQPYKALPHFLAGWDVCLLPFALNESTRFISPTKTLEYMAARLPIVSTPVRDVADVYSDIVHIAHDGAEFVAACEAALLEAPDVRAAKLVRMREILMRTSWDHTAHSMHQLMQQALRRRADGLRSEAPFVEMQDSAASAPAAEPAAVTALHAANATAASRADASATAVKTLVIGAGPTGLSAAYHLDQDTLLLDRNPTVGGWCRSISEGGYTFDHSGHVLFSGDEWVRRLVTILLGDNLHWQECEAWIYSKGVHTRYPFHSALHGLPPNVIADCIVGAAHARFGMPGVPDSASDAGTPRNFEEFIHRVWGHGVAEHFALPYNRKLWTVPLTEIETSWLGEPAPLPDIRQMVVGALRQPSRPTGPEARFGYPLRGGFQALMNGFLPHIRGAIELDAEVVAISPAQRTVMLADGRRFRYDSLISTMPMPELVRLTGSEAPTAVREAAAGLRHVSLRCVNFGVARADLTDRHWIYYPEDTVFHRVFAQGNASPECNPPGGFGLTCEISHSPWKPLPADGDALAERCRADLVKVGLLREDDVLSLVNQVDMQYAYVIFDHARARNVAIIRDWMSAQDIVPAGRFGEWDYYNADHAFQSGRRAAQEASRIRAGRSESDQSDRNAAGAME